ncbi:MAG: RNA polymerase sporulation sigma factor SigG [Angelakisella sp.]|nr:RNA polymerase sporulation sigma factor SigG [Angelakisella sp.]MCI9666339.1 RNA polymerase sporulation sigma factor SigG [Angelakisella sp.]
MYQNRVEICGVNTAKLPVLGEEEKMELIYKAQAGDEAAREKLINGNLRLVLSVIQRFTGRGENMDDLFQVGVIGLIKSIDNFKPEYGLRLSTYSCPMIIGEVRRYLRDHGMVRVSRSIRDTAYKALQIREELTKKHRREPSVGEIAEEMGCPKEDVVLALEAIVEPASLQEPVYSDGRDTIYIMDQVKDSCTDSDWLGEISFRQAIESLGEREKKILSLRFMSGKTQIQVSQEVGISQAQVSRIEKGALERIKKQL